MVFCLWLGGVLTGVSSIALHAQVRRALLIGIGDYAPPAGAQMPIPSAGHAPDSRFAPGASWVSLHGPATDVAAMQVLLKHKFGFEDIRVLPEQQATREGILAAIDQLVADTHPGDFDVFYYSGHGSRRRDTLSSKGGFDQTIVPIDAWKGAEDIRDKELALKFDKIVYDKRAHLTAIYDSCDSGTMARGVTASVLRALPYDDRDVAQEKKRDPATVTELDLKQIPQKGDAIVLAAAAPDESAVEAEYSDDHQYHGAFTRALVRVLESSTQTLSAEDLVAEVADMLHADSVPFQQPSAEGRTRQSLFGDPVAEHPLHARVTGISDKTVTLDMGSAAGFDVGTQFTALEAGAGGKKTVIEVQHIDEPLISKARIVDGPADVKAGQIFELSKMIYPEAARLVIFVPRPVSDRSDAIAAAKKLFPDLAWVDDPTVKPIDFLVMDGEQGWAAYNRSGQAVKPEGKPKGTAFLLVGPPQPLRDAIEQSVPFKRNAFSFTQQLGEANYMLAMRPVDGGAPEYAFIDPIVLAPHKADAYLRSAEDDPDDTAMNGGKPPENVCRNDVSLPVRTAWLHASPDGGNDLILALNRRIVRLGKLRVWLQSPALAPGVTNWPYHLAVTEPGSDTAIGGLLHPGQSYEIRLLTTAGERSAANTIPMYPYVFGFDCAANPFLLYPEKELGGAAPIPQPGPDGVYPLSVKLMREQVGTPLGADTLFLLATKQRLTDPDVLIADGVLEEGRRGAESGFDELVTSMSNAGTRGPRSSPSNWLVQQLVLPSRP